MQVLSSGGCWKGDIMGSKTSQKTLANSPDNVKYLLTLPKSRLSCSRCREFITCTAMRTLVVQRFQRSENIDCIFCKIFCFVMITILYIFLFLLTIIIMILLVLFSSVPLIFILPMLSNKFVQKMQWFFFFKFLALLSSQICRWRKNSILVEQGV